MGSDAWTSLLWWQEGRAECFREIIGDCEERFRSGVGRTRSSPMGLRSPPPSIRMSWGAWRTNRRVQHLASDYPPCGKGSSNAITSTIGRWAARTAYLTAFRSTRKLTEWPESSREDENDFTPGSPSLRFAQANASTVGAIATLTLCLVSPAALSQPCGSLATVSDLFAHSQLAERPEERKGEPTHCPGTQTPIVPAVPELSPLNVPGPSRDRLERVLDRQVNDRALVERTDDDRLLVGCKERILGVFDFDIAVEMRFFRPNTGADVVQLKMVSRSTGGTVGDWTPIISPNGTITFPGTDLSQAKQILSNFHGEKCVFPVARYAVWASCARVNSEDESASSTTLRTENDRLTVVGHSLGGAVAQFVAISGPPTIVPNDEVSWQMCPEVNAYAFGSIGLTSSTASAHPSVHGTLTSYASDCDGLVQGLFSQNVQTGRLFTLSSGSHSIDGIQGDLCGCLRGKGNRAFLDYRVPESPPKTRFCALPRAERKSLSLRRPSTGR